MCIWIQVVKRAVLALLVVVLAFAWSRTGRAQTAPCLVERGQDPLDVLNSGVRHNVWVILDTSGSMGSTFNNSVDNRSKLRVAKDVINRLMDELVDGAGRPLVNWAFVPYDEQVRSGSKCPAVPPDENGDNYPDEPDGCHGLQDDAYVNPGSCGVDSRDAVRDVLSSLGSAGGTPIGVAFTDLASYIIGQHQPNDPSVPGNTTNFITDLLPNQKNFIVHVTDGQDTCECEDGGYPSMPGDPLITPVAVRPSQSDPNLTVSSSDGGDIASFNAGLKGEFALKTIDPALDGEKGNIFTIGMDLDPSDKDKINTIAWMASGANLLPQRERSLMNPGFFADSPDELVKAFQDVFARIGIPESEVTLGSAVVSSVKEVISSHTNPAVSREDVLPFDLSNPDAIRAARAIRADHQNNVMFTTSVEIPSFRGHLKATNLYTVSDPTLPRQARDPDFTQIWDAGVELQDDDPDSRLLFFNKRGSTNLLPFDTSNVTPQDLGVAQGYLSEIDGFGAQTDADARDIVVKVIRGYRLSIDPTTGTIYDSNGDLNLSPLDESGNPTWKLYESTARAVAVVSSPPRSPDFDPPLSHATEYGVGGAIAGDGFFWDHINRKTVVYYSSNSGILHAFDAEDGRELFGFLPDDAVGLDPLEVPGSRDTLKDFVRLVVAENNGVINHKFMLSGAPTVSDAFLRSDLGGDDAWHTLLAFGRGPGGRFLTLLDVTEAPGNPFALRLRWNRGNREGISEGPIDGLGETWSTPVLGNVDTRGDPNLSDTRVDQWLVFAGGGYGCDNADNEGQFLFAFRAEDGFIHFRGQVTNDTSAPIDQNALVARPTLFNPHREDVFDNKDFVTRVYIPDLQGRVWKLDTTDTDPLNWTFQVFAEMGLSHPITAPVTVLNDPFTPERVFVMVGSGGDRRAPVPVEGFEFRIWIDSDRDGQNTTQFAANDPAAFERSFNEEERMFTQAVTVGSIGDPRPPVVFFAASQEEFDTTACESAFTSTLFSVGVESGFPEFDLDSSQTGSEAADLGEGKVQGLFVRDGNLYVSESGGLGSSGSIGIWGESAFDDEPPARSNSQFTLQLLVEGFRISPF